MEEIIFFYICCNIWWYISVADGFVGCQAAQILWLDTDVSEIPVGPIFGGSAWAMQTASTTPRRKIKKSY
jgi:hypothetical protein